MRQIDQDDPIDDDPLLKAGEEEGGDNPPAGYQADHPRRRDTLFALATGAFVSLLHLLWRFPCVHPSGWPDLAVAAGLRPPFGLCPGVWRAIVRPLFRLHALDESLLALRAAGIFAAGLTAALAYALIREALAVTVRQFSRSRSWRNVVAPLVSFAGSALLSCAEPVWVASQSFSPAGLSLLEVMAASLLLARHARLGGLWRLSLSLFLFGFLSGEYAIGIVLTVGAVIAFVRLLADARASNLPLAEAHPDATPIPLPAASWLLGFLLSVTLSVRSFIAAGGPDVWEWSVRSLPLHYISSYLFTALASANLFGWLGFAAVAVVPFILSAGYGRSALDDDQAFPDARLGSLAITFAFALAQLSAVSFAWYWRWFGLIAVHSQALLCLSSFLSAGTVALALAAFGFRLSCHASLSEDPKRRDGLLIFLAVLVVLVLSVPGRYAGQRRAALRVVRDYVRETARECGGAKWLFTDGSLDEGIELATLRNGRPVNALPMIAGAGPRETFIRLRGSAGEEERIALREGASSTLKAWKRDFPRNLTNSAVQIGFEFWRQTKEPLPPCSGVLARPAGFAPGEAERGIQAANDLAERILDLAEAGVFGGAGDPAVEERLVQVQWRLARMAQTRAIAADLAGDRETALREADFAEQLDKANPSLRSLNARIGRAGIRALRTMSPREHLREALRRADFTAAKPYAEAVLATDSGNADANFAIGMFYFVEELYSKAEIYLERAARRRPDEPTFFNNLAIAQLMTRHFDLAEKNARRALELLPESPEVRDTVRQVEKARLTGGTAP